MAYWRTCYHFVWATKDRRPLITPEIEPVLFHYLDGKAREFSAAVYALDGWTDHVHMVASLPPRYSVAEFVKGLKGASSHYLNHRPGVVGDFYWQEGYGVFTLGDRQRPAAVAYVENQKMHHRRGTVNRWLEQTADGPETDSTERTRNDSTERILRESAARYDAGLPEDWPF